MRKLLPVLIEGLFAVVVAVGVGLIYPPAGLIVAGVLGIVACERGELP